MVLGGANEMQLATGCAKRLKMRMPSIEIASLMTGGRLRTASAVSRISREAYLRTKIACGDELRNVDAGEPRHDQLLHLEGN